jgi:hypothetical protein
MSSPAEPPRPLRLAAHAIPLGLLTLAVIPIYLSLDTTWQARFVRGGCALAATLASFRLLRRVRQAAADHPVSPADAPPTPPPPPAVLDEIFLRRRDELTYSVRSRRYFDAVLWPRLQGLAGRELSAPPRRPWFSRLGPTRSMIESLVAQIERRP